MSKIKLIDDVHKIMLLKKQIKQGLKERYNEYKNINKDFFSIQCEVFWDSLQNDEIEELQSIRKEKTYDSSKLKF